MKFNPTLKVWGSPWTAPIWMKTVNNCWGPSDPNSDQCAVNQSPSILRAYALYFSKAVSLYKAEGLPFFALSFQNELRVCQPFPSTRWTGATGRDFMNNYLAPKMKADHPDVQLWTPTMNVADVANYFAPMLNGCKDIVATCFQYEGEQVMAQVHSQWPNIKTYATELACGGGENSWDYPLSQTFVEIKNTITNGGVSGVCQWNLVLDKSYSSGSFVNFKQNCMITIDSVAKTYTLQTQYYGLKHFSYYIRPGAKILKVSGGYANSAVPAQNPSGSIAVVTENNSAGAKTVAVHWGNQMVSAQLPAYSFGSFLIWDSLTTGTMSNVHGMPAKSLVPVNRIFTIASGKPRLPNEFLGKVCQGAIFDTKGRLIREFSGYVGYGAANANLLGDLKSAQGVYIVQVKAVLQ
jgi:glucosylceramidase